MVLGIRGQVSEIERDNSVHRMVEARWNKARRGEVFTMVLARHDLDELGRLSLTSDQAVARQHFAVPIERHHDKARQLGLARVVRPFLLRRTKAEVAPELPSRTEMN